MKVQLYTFDVRSNTSYKIAKHLEIAGEEILYLTPQFSFHLNSAFTPETYFLGFGDFTKSAHKMRIETFAQNKYGNRTILPGKEELFPLTHEFELSRSLYLSTSVTNGPCNRAAYFFASQYGSDHSAFVHIPHLFDKVIGKDTLLDIKQQWEKKLLS